MFIWTHHPLRKYVDPLMSLIRSTTVVQLQVEYCMWVRQMVPGHMLLYIWYGILTILVEEWDQFRSHLRVQSLHHGQLQVFSLCCLDTVITEIGISISYYHFDYPIGSYLFRCVACSRNKKKIKNQLHRCTSAIRNRTSILIDTTSEHKMGSPKRFSRMSANRTQTGSYLSA